MTGPGEHARAGVDRPRARDIGLRIGAFPTGRFNAITDVPGVLVGHATVWFGEGDLRPGHGPARTGVTVVLPHCENLFEDRVPGAYVQFNGFGKCVGIEQLDELGVIETPIALTSTLAVGLVADGLISHAIRANPEIGIAAPTVNPLVAECNDGYLNDIQGRHITRQHIDQAIASASSGPIEEGSVGAGTGMSMFGFKGGIGTSSRRIPGEFGGYTIGVLVLANFGTMEDLIIDGVPVGRFFSQPDRAEEKGSIVMIVATDAPLLDRQLRRLGRRTMLGLARTGSMGGHGSGDIAIAFSSAPSVRSRRAPSAWVSPVSLLAESGIGGSSAAIDSLFRAVVEATEEAILNALFRASTVVGRDGHVREAIPIDDVLPILAKRGRLSL